MFENADFGTGNERELIHTDSGSGSAEEIDNSKTSERS